MTSSKRPWVLFDLDGTLINSIPLILASMHHTREAYQLEPWSDDKVLVGVGTPLLVHLADWADGVCGVDEMVATYREHNHFHHDKMVRPFAGVRLALDSLQEAGVGLGIVTSKSHALALRGLNICQVQAPFEVLIGSDDVQRHKPHPEPIHAALKQVGAEAEHAWYVGDAIHDLVAGRAAGVKTAAALWGPFHRDVLNPGAPDRWLQAPAEMADLAQS